MSEEERLKDRAAGCMLGLAIGDALGAPYEFAGEGAAGAVAMRFLEWGGLPAGSYTDDTQMSIATAESILACGKLDVEDLARRFAGMAGEIRGIGTTTRLVLEKIRGGASAQHAAEATHLELGGKSAGNGAIMRIAPVAVAYWMDIPALDAAARAAAGIVHYDKVAQDAATAVAQVLAFLLSGATRIEQALATAEVLFMEKGREVALALRDGATARAGELKPGSAYVLDTLACVVWALLEGESYEE
ncbi:MAG: ADP-ribosylglycohydrolase family protein, partial [Planctomycetes bacterium]|nr:ADP-ribosylglycohydrolase family protein [Planctomycetota bacterium]